jgi:hypothetical protein
MTEEKDQDFVVKCPYCHQEFKSAHRDEAIDETVWHSVRRHPNRAVVAELQKAGFEYQGQRPTTRKGAASVRRLLYLQADSLRR